MLKLMYITNDPQVAAIAQAAGVDRIFVDLETIGKQERQGGMDTVQSRHSIEDVRALRPVLTSSKLLVRVNPIHPGSQDEIDAVIRTGADVLMLPYFHTAQQVSDFLRFADGRARTMLLFETPASVEHLDEILALDGIDECYIGLNDLHLGYGQKFMFQLLADGTVEQICKKFTAAGKPYGFGGIARGGTGTLPAERIIAEHVRLGSQAVILARSFCNTALISDPDEISRTFQQEVPKIRQTEQLCAAYSPEEFQTNTETVRQIVQNIVGGLR